jgi:hypothetical protein
MDFGDGDVRYFYEWKGSGKGWHDDVWEKIWKLYPKLRNETDGAEVVGRIWPEKEICSIYENKSAYSAYKPTIEALFKELKLDINDFLFEYGDSAMRDAMYPWSHFKSSSTKQSKSPEQIQAAKQLIDLTKNYHIANPVEKIKIRAQLSQLRKVLGMTEDELQSTINNVSAALERQYGSIARANYEKGAIAEEKMTLRHNNLDPMIWLPNGKLRPEVRKRLLLIANDFFKSKDLKSPLYDVHLVGSMAGFNYNQESDIDLHPLVDMKALGIPDQYIKQFGKGLTSKWNQEHDVQIRGHKVEIYVQDVHETLHSEGIYSLYKDQWIKVPRNLQVQFDKESIKKTYYEFVKLIDDAIAEKNIAAMRELFDKITDLRKVGMERQGEFSTGNLVFKILRTKGHIDRLKSEMNTEFDKKASLNESNSTPKLESLKKGRRTLTPEERNQVVSAGAVWSDGSPGVWKSMVNGKTWYVCNTHRSYECKPTIEGAIKSFEFIESTS